MLIKSTLLAKINNFAHLFLAIFEKIHKIQEFIDLHFPLNIYYIVLVQLNENLENC